MRTNPKGYLQRLFNFSRGAAGSQSNFSNARICESSGRGRTVVIRVRGNSMEPTIRSGCSVLVDPHDKVVLGGGRIYAIKLNGRLAIKRLVPIGKERIKIWADNPDFEPMHLTTQEAEKDLEIIGHVWGHITEHV